MNPNPNQPSTSPLSSLRRDKVLAIVGPQSSRQAVPAGGVANDEEVPLITPWSTNPEATKDRPWVFRGAFLDPFQAPVAVDFASKTFKAKKWPAVVFEVFQRLLQRSGRQLQGSL